MPRTPSLQLQVRQLVTATYLESRDFNGTSLRALAKQLSRDEPEVLKAIGALIRRGAIAAVFGDVHPNPAIRALRDEPIPTQLEKLNAHRASYTCFYPTEATLARAVPKTLHLDRPFTRQLALGRPQLDHVAFDLTILEFYRNDPRYYYSTSDIDGRIRVRDDYFQLNNMDEKDQILLQSFGFCYNAKGERAVAVFPRYLSDLSPEHQQFWYTRTLAGEYHLHPDYLRASFGHWPLGGSIFDAVLAEMRLINTMCHYIGRPPFFRDTYDDARPPEFAFLIRPTQKEFDAFVQTLDKMLSDNINFDFFLGEVDLERRERRRDGTYVARQKGSLAVLREWLDITFVPDNPARVNTMFETLKHIRALRSRIAHIIQSDAFDQRLIVKQRELIVDTFKAVRILRQILGNWPETRECEIPPFLTGAMKVWII